MPSICPDRVEDWAAGPTTLEHLHGTKAAEPLLSRTTSGYSILFLLSPHRLCALDCGEKLGTHSQHFPYDFYTTRPPFRDYGNNIDIMNTFMWSMRNSARKETPAEVV